MVKVYINRFNKVVPVFEEEAELLIAKYLACLPENKPDVTEEKAIKPDYENKALKTKGRPKKQ